MYLCIFINESDTNQGQIQNFSSYRGEGVQTDELNAKDLFEWKIKQIASMTKLMTLMTDQKPN